MALSLEDQAGRDQLQTLNHIVVVMMENRSFDHMLGYLKREGMAEVDGLRDDDCNLDRRTRRRVHPFDAEATKSAAEARRSQKRLDPDHSPKGVGSSSGPGSGAGLQRGFVRSFSKAASRRTTTARSSGSVPMGYYTGQGPARLRPPRAPVLRLRPLVRSIPGDTWPNRCYSLAGTREPTSCRRPLLSSDRSGRWDSADAPLRRRRRSPAS